VVIERAGDMVAQIETYHRTGTAQAEIVDTLTVAVQWLRGPLPHGWAVGSRLSRRGVHRPAPTRTAHAAHRRPDAGTATHPVKNQLIITGARMIAYWSADDLDLHTLLRVQDGLATRAQLVAAGVSRSMVRRRVHGGNWQQTLPGVYLVTAPAARFTPRQRLLAALLYGGNGTRLTGVEALRLHGFDHLPDDQYVRILVPHVRQIRPAGFVCVHRTRRPDPNPVTFDPLVAVSVARAVADTGRCLRWGSPGQIHRLVGQALDRRLTTVGELADTRTHRNCASSGMPSRIAATAVDTPTTYHSSTLFAEHEREDTAGHDACSFTASGDLRLHGSSTDASASALPL
jgi:hypothetical protein